LPDLPLGLRGRRPRLAAALAGGLLANFSACTARLCGLQSTSKIAGQAASVRATIFYTLKQNFLIRSSSAMPQSTQKTKQCGMPSLLRSVL